MPTVTVSAYASDSDSCDRPQRDQQLSPPKVFSFQALARIVLLCILFLMSLPLHVTADWTAPYFIVQPMDPWESIMKANNDKLPANLSFMPLSNFLARQTQKSKAASTYLHEVGKIYADIGLKEPNFGPMPMSNTRFVYMFNFPGSLTSDSKDAFATYLSAHCDPIFKTSWMALNTNTSGIYQYKTIAHELFHPIQEQYPFSKGHCKGDQWIFEGTADAAGFFLMEKKMKEEKGLSLPKKDYKFYGVRPYDVPLNEASAWHQTYVKTRVGLELKDAEAVKSWFGYRTSSFWRFLMDRYGPISKKDSFEIDRLLALSEGFMKRVAPVGGVDWLPWVAKGVEDNWGVFQHVYGEFLAEFAAWPGGKYPTNKLSTNFLLEKGFGGCEPVVLSYGNKSTIPIMLKPRTGSGKALYPIAGRCIQVTINNVPIGAKLKLELEAHASSSDIAEQLVLGFAREEHGKTLVDNCYSHARKDKNKATAFPCLFYGKVKKLEGKKPTTGIRTWRFDARKAKHSTITTTFVLTNVDPLKADDTDGIKELKVIIGFPKSKGKTRKGAQLDLPESFNFGELPDVNIPRRQLLYGIKKKSAISTGYPMNLGPIQVAALDEAGKKTETYVITPMEHVAFGQTGPFKAMVMVGGDGGSPTGIISSLYCDPSTQAEGIGTIMRSDDEILKISIDTPLCELSFNNIAACQDGCPVVDHFQGELSLPFGWRYFAENEVEDLVTPGVLLDIDRYHHEVFGTPLQGLPGGPNGSSGGGPGSSGENAGGGNGAGQQGSTSIPPCDCSCEAYKKQRERLDEMKGTNKPDFNLASEMLRCAQQCVKPFRDCRRAQKAR